jgi:hypothetical protein
MSDAYLYKSYPAARADPRVGSLAFSDKRFMRRLEGGVYSASEVDIFRFFVWQDSDIVDGNKQELTVFRSGV